MVTPKEYECNAYIGASVAKRAPLSFEKPLDGRTLQIVCSCNATENKEDPLMDRYDNRYPNDNVNWVQLFFKGEIMLFIAKLLAVFGLVIGFIVFAIANSYSQDAGMFVVWCLLGAPVVIFVYCVLAIIYRLFNPKMSSRERYIAQQAQRPWPDPTPWAGQHPIELRQTRTDNAVTPFYNPPGGVSRARGRVEPTFSR